METKILTSSEDLRKYDSWVRSHPEGSLWQSLEWKTYQEALGREVRIYAAMEDGQIVASALVVIDRTSFGLSTWEVSRGPLGRIENGKLRIENTEFFTRIIADARKTNCISVYASPTHSFSILNSQFSISGRLVYPEATRIIDLNLSEEALLQQMKPKGRYNIRLAEKHGVRVEHSDDIGAYSALAKETWARDGFRGPKRGYGKFLEHLSGSLLLLAFADTKKTPSEGRQDLAEGPTAQKPVAGLLGVIWGSTGLYYYGASSDRHRDLMAPYLLQWEAMKECKARGCTSYDLFGVAPEGAVNHPWAGVSAFKEKFGGSIVTYPPEQEIVLRPGMKTLLSMKRKLIG